MADTPKGQLTIPDITPEGFYTRPVVPAAPTAPAPAAATTTSTTAAPKQDMDGYEKAVAHYLMRQGGVRMTGKDGKIGWVFKNGKTTEENTADFLDLWNNSDDATRQAMVTAATPARIGAGGGVQSPFRPVPPKGFSGLGNMPAPTSSQTVYSGISGDPALAAQAKTDAAMGVTSRGSNGSVTFSSGAAISPANQAGPVKAGEPVRTLTSPYGTGSVTFGAPKSAAVFYGTNKGDSTPMTFAQATGKVAPPPAGAQPQPQSQPASPMLAEVDNFQPVQRIGNSIWNPTAPTGQQMSLAPQPVSGAGSKPLPRISSSTQLGTPPALPSNPAPQPAAQQSTVLPPAVMTPVEQAVAAAKLQTGLALGRAQDAAVNASSSIANEATTGAKVGYAISPPGVVRNVTKNLQKAVQWATTPRPIR